MTTRMPQTLFVISLLIVCSGCKENKSTEITNPKKNSAGFILDDKKTGQPQILKSELFLHSISINQYHIGQDQPTLYSANLFSKIVLYNLMNPDTKEWGLDHIDIHFNDGSVKREHSVKVWNVDLRITGGHSTKPVLIEQQFIQSQ